MNIVEEARAFAVRVHGEQKYGPHAYVYHLDAVAKNAQPYGEAAQAIAYLHDVVEDTPTTIEAVREAFGDEIADGVELCTDAKDGNRKERKAKTNAKLAASNCRLGLIVKACDRLANVRESVQTRNHSKLRMYVDEHPPFREAAYRAGWCDAMWAEIDALLAGKIN